MTEDPPLEDISLPSEAYIALRCDLLVIGDSIITDRHHASGGNYDPTDPANQIGGTIPSFSLSGWLRHGMERAIQRRGGTACHPGEANANFKKSDVYERDLEDGYHPKGACRERGTPCLLAELFGELGGPPGTLLRRPIRFSPVRSAVTYEDGEAEGHYRRLSRHIASRNRDDGRQSLRSVELDAVANLDGTWYLHFREPSPASFGLLAAAVDFLAERRMDFMHQLGGARNNGAGIIEPTLCNPLYSTRELRRVFNRSRKPTAAMDEADEEWADTVRPACEKALQTRIDATDMEATDA
ncbi:hypothetical protein [Halobaculum sp. EA56]|uniref:hypothetical protein n=1 Tax=Halobaculum sp. EA56 TaxID=3421648 RepID=UPI003EBA8B42